MGRDRDVGEVTSGPQEKMAIRHVVLLVGGAVASRTVHIPVARPAGNRPTQIGVRAKPAASALSSGSSRSPRHPGTTGSRPHDLDDVQIASTTNSGCCVRHGACFGLRSPACREYDRATRVAEPVGRRRSRSMRWHWRSDGGARAAFSATRAGGRQRRRMNHSCAGWYLQPR